jgi:hypothetical protein
MSNKGLWIGPDFEHTDYLIIEFEQNLLSNFKRLII